MSSSSSPGSKSPSDERRSKSQSAPDQCSPKEQDDSSEIVELRHQLEERTAEIQALKLELERYKIALQKSVPETRHTGQQCEDSDFKPSVSSPSASTTKDNQNSSDILSANKRTQSNHPSRPTKGSRMTPVVFKAGASDEDEEVDKVTSGTMWSNDDTIPDVGEIDLNLNLDDNEEVYDECVDKKQSEDVKHATSSRSLKSPINEKRDADTTKSNVGDKTEGAGSEDDDDNMADGLLTSLTDAAINNLSQLAALQERCESQLQHSQPYHSQQPNNQNQSGRAQTVVRGTDELLPQQQLHRRQQQQPSAPSASSIHPIDSGPFSAGLSLASTGINIPASNAGVRNLSGRSSAPSSNPLSSVNNQHRANTSDSSHPGHLPHQSTATHSQIADLTNTGQSLANALAAMAAAAVARQDGTEPVTLHPQTIQQQHPHITHLANEGPPPTARLISSAMSPSDYYHGLHLSQHAHASPTVSSPTGLTPSPTGPMIASLTAAATAAAAAARRTTCTSAGAQQPVATSGLLSTMSSPTTINSGFLRRQFMHPGGDSRYSIPSPTPSSGLGSSPSLTPASLMQHLLQHSRQMQQVTQHGSPALHQQPQQQQRSASALAGTSMCASSPSQSPIGASSSMLATAVATSPLMSSKSSSQARLNNMQIKHKFGYLGSGRAQFNSPHGFCLGLSQEIVVADTNNHRVCIFDKDGTYIAQFGTPGKEDGQLWNPRKVAILHKTISAMSTTAATSSEAQQSAHNLGSHNSSNSSSASGALATCYPGAGSTVHSGASASASGFGVQQQQQQLQKLSEPMYVVCDRGADRSRMQLFTKDGAFIRKIGIHYIDIVAGLAITQDGSIVVVDSVSPTVYIIDAETGAMNGWFDCSGHMKEPSDIAVKPDAPEYFICDFKGHCVVVFSESGNYLRKIGHEGLTSYPNGIDISDDGDILVGDSHGNRFHVVVFDRNGNFVSQFECPHVKVSRCCGLKITREGYIVTLAKNNHHVLVLDTIHI